MIPTKKQAKQSGLLLLLQHRWNLEFCPYKYTKVNSLQILTQKHELGRFQTYSGNSIVKAASFQFLTIQNRIQSQSSPCESSGGQSDNKADLSPSTLLFSFWSTFHQCSTRMLLLSPSSPPPPSWAGTTGSFDAAVPRNSVSSNSHHHFCHRLPESKNTPHGHQNPIL